MKKRVHEPVLVKEVISALHIKETGLYIDATVGAGGHAVEIVKAGGKVLGIDTDPAMLAIADKVLRETTTNFKLCQGSFVDIDKIASNCGFERVDGIVFDLGVSTAHYKSTRGFSFEDPSVDLDMRLDPTSQGVTAADLLNSLRVDQLRAMFVRVLGKNEAARVTQQVVDKREKSKFRTVGDFLALFGKKEQGRLHPATKAFLALRIAVNSELESLKEALPKAFLILKPTGKLLVISFHSLEDRIVKNFYKEKSDVGEAMILTKKPIAPTEQEIKGNPAARSAKLRILVKK